MLRSPRQAFQEFVLIKMVFECFLPAHEDHRNLFLESLEGFPVFQNVHLAKFKGVLVPERLQLRLHFITQAATRLRVEHDLHERHGKVIIGEG